MQLLKTQINEMEQRYRATFINSLGGFKSLVLIGTADSSGVPNLAVFNSLFHLGANPPLCGLIFRPDSAERHTLDNILQTGWYTVNHVKESFYQAAHQTSARYPKSVSEFEAVGLTPQWDLEKSVPYVAESTVKWLMKFREKQDLTINGTHLIIGEIMEVMLPENALHQDGFVDIEQAGSLTCSGLDSYHSTERIARLPYAKPQPEFLQ
jgi:flavin reductase (DIM6/NTAB) family NADH-FMN oxidoreductase RutF